MDELIKLAPIQADINTLASQGFEVTGLLVDSEFEGKLTDVFFRLRFDCGVRVVQAGPNKSRPDIIFGVKIHYSESALPNGYEIIVKSPLHTNKVI